MFNQESNCTGLQLKETECNWPWRVSENWSPIRRNLNEVSKSLDLALTDDDKKISFYHHINRQCMIFGCNHEQWCLPAMTNYTLIAAIFVLPFGVGYGWIWTSVTYARVRTNLSLSYGLLLWHRGGDCWGRGGYWGWTRYHRRRTHMLRVLGMLRMLLHVRSDRNLLLRRNLKHISPTIIIEKSLTIKMWVFMAKGRRSQSPQTYLKFKQKTHS